MAMGAKGFSPPINNGSQFRGSKRNKNALFLVFRSKAFRLELCLGFALVLASRDIKPNMLAINNNMQILVVVSWLIQYLKIVA